jgi:hypothetical protein
MLSPPRDSEIFTRRTIYISLNLQCALLSVANICVERLFEIVSFEIAKNLKRVTLANPATESSKP